MKKLLILLLCCCVYGVQAQVYNNEWIDFGRTYYKIKVGKTGLHRIAKSDLSAAGLASVPVEQLQLWRNGAEVPLFTPAPSGPLPDDAFIEFWGERNDGKGEKPLYRRPEYQLNDRYSLQTDTSIYFLTVNITGNNKRFAETDNNLAGNTLAPEPYFQYTLNQSFNNQLNSGYALDLDQYLYSAAYDLGEGYSSAFIGTNGTNAINLGNLAVANNGPAAQFKITLMGNRSAQRRYRVQINNDSIAGKEVSLFNAATDSVAVPLSVISTGTNNVQVFNITATAGDRLAVYGYDLTYPRLFQFGNAANFEFSLPAGNAPRYLEITAFNNSGLPPVLLDRANGLRLLGDISVAGKIRFLLPPLAQAGSMILYSQSVSNLTAVGALQERRFIDYGAAANQADYLIISNQLLFNNGEGVNAVAQYAQYRGSAAGGSYNTRVYDVEELTDQFGWGIKKTPLAIRNFIFYAVNRFAVKPKQVLLLGKGTVYTDQRARESDPNINRLNLVPTFGNPASDILLAAAPGTTVPLLSIGRLSVVNAQEILDYLEKVKQYEAAQAAVLPEPDAMLWKKNVAHIIGSGDANLQTSLEAYMSGCKAIISDTLWGAAVHTFAKKTGANIEQISDKALERLFEEGISLITYFGHSSNTGLDYNLDNPEAYRNEGKYPLFLAMGCNAGNLFGFGTGRFTSKDAISEKYVLAPQKGTIGFIASSHFGIVSTLMPWNKHFYETISREHYGATIGELMQATAARTFANTVNGDENYMVRVNIEENIFHGDPALRLNVQPKPDYAIRDAQVKIEPAFVSIADTVFNLKIDVRNLGQAIHKNLILSVKRQYPNNTEKELFRDSIAAPFLLSNHEYAIPVDGLQDKGMNLLTVTIDADDAAEELFESNNSVAKEVFVYEEEAKPIYPYNFGIVTRPGVKLFVSTANPLIGRKAYEVEMDTTELFNSAAKWSQTINSAGGLIEVTPNVLLRNNTVYYWRVSVVPDSGAYRWNNSSFVYLLDGGEGFNQSHLYQHLKSAGSSLGVDSAGVWRFGKVNHNLFARNAIFPTGGDQESDFTVSIDGAAIVRSACVGRSLSFTVLDARSFKPWLNVNAQGQSLFLYGSGPASCRPGRQYNFEYSYMTASSRKLMMDFMDTIPDGSFVVVRSQDSNNPASFASTWMSDTLLYGPGKSLYHKLVQAGFAAIDSISIPRAWLLIYQKGNPAATRFAYTQGVFDKITLSQDFMVDDIQGSLVSPIAGPAKSWKNFVWDGAKDNTGEYAALSIIGVRAGGGADTLLSGIDVSTGLIDISSIDAGAYPYLRLALKTSDTVNYTPYNLANWRLNYTPAPEGAIAPNIFFQTKDTLDVGADFEFKTAFKNVSTAAFDSLAVKIIVTDQSNVAHVWPVFKHKPLGTNDTVHVRTTIDPKLFAGSNTLYVQVNPDGAQPEQFSFNNFLYRNFYVRDDQSAPIVDVTFDNVRIMSRDIVSAKPDILIKLTDNSDALLLNDTSLLTIKVRNLTTKKVRTYNFDNDTVRFVPATQASQNVASVTFKPFFAEDGEYELIVSGKDRRGNVAGGTDYRVSFQVINKPMISNMLNYPNPFTTATAFVFTLTGAEVPQNLKVQVLTITGKVVREITRTELGTLRIGRNITEFKWDGTDQWRQKLANGVYLYRVIAQQNGKALDKYKAANDQTDQFFNKGYGKMYLMR